MTELAKNVFTTLITEECYEKYFYEMDFFDGHCFKALLSKSLGYSIIAGSVLVKIPQILKILQNQSAQGLNILSVFLELLAITLNVSYSFVRQFPFSAYGDGTFLGLQTAIIACLVLFYGGSVVKVFLFLVAYTSACYVLMGITPVNILWTLQAFNIPIIVIGRLTQARTNYINKSTGQLSAVTCFMLFFGSMARIFTSIQETGDLVMILTYTSSTCTNGVIVFQLLYYWNIGKKDVGPVKPTKKSNKLKSKKVD